jgi:AraC-like DNA-binding protein
MERVHGATEQPEKPQWEWRLPAGAPHPLSRLRIEVVSANEADDALQWQGMAVPRREWYTRLYLAKDGYGQVRTGDTLLELKPRRLYLLPSSCEHEFLESPNFAHHWVHFTATLVSGLSLFEWIDCPREHSPSDYELSVELMRRVKELCPSTDWREQLQLKSILRQLLQPFFDRAELLNELHVSAFTRLQPVFRYIEQHLADPIRIADLARVVHLHPTYFSNLFSKHMGRPPQEYVIARRIDNAQLLLSGSDMPIKQIAAEVGIEDPYHFSNLFRRKVGVSPSAYRSQVSHGA